jgi:hypothetical protein
MAQAENIISQIWQVLEKHDMPSPQLAMDSEDGRLAIRLFFQSGRDADMVTDIVKQSTSDAATDGSVLPHTCD